MLNKTIKTVRKTMEVKPRTDAELERDTRQLRRLERLVDVIFALLIWAVFQNLPIPSAEEFDKLSNLQLINKYRDSLIIIFIGLFFIVTYWIQNNKLIGNLARTDGRHVILIIIQVSFLLLYMYAVILELEFPGNSVALAAQGFTLAMSGFIGVVSWSYAKKNRRLLANAIDDEEAEKMRIGILAEPLAAAFTIPFAFIGPGAWNLSWLSLIFFSWWLKRRYKRKHEAEQSGE
jgi:uncharacterized membrane protein